MRDDALFCDDDARSEMLFAGAASRRKNASSLCAKKEVSTDATRLVWR